MKTILIVEDNDAIREDVAEMLALANYRILSAENGKIGIALAREHRPDLIISDVMMPVVDGFGMLHMLRRDPLTEAIPIIFLTSKTERNDFRNAMESGADDYITKPFNNDELLKAIENRFRRLAAVGKKFIGVAEALDEAVDGAPGIESLFEGRETRIYRKKETIYKEGGMPRYLYQVISGKARTSKMHDIGKSLSLDLYKAGDYMGYIALLENSAYKETADAMEDDTEIAMVPRKEFDDLLLKNPEVARKMIKILARNVAEKEQHLLDIAYSTLRQKVAGTLVSLYRKYHTQNGELYSIDLSRDELASIAGTAIESFIRMLADFRSEQLIEIKKDNKIEIINFAKLEKIAG